LLSELLLEDKTLVLEDKTLELFALEIRLLAELMLVARLLA
jgi:hypothetical protein